MAIYTMEQMEEMNTDQLKQIAKNLDLSGYSKARKYDIIDMIMEVQGNVISPDVLADKTKKEIEKIARTAGIKVAKADTKEQIINQVLAVADPDPNKVHAFSGGVEGVRDMVGNNPTTIVVSCGASSGKFPVTGKTVQAVGDFLKEILNIDAAANAIVNGEEVQKSYTLAEGDTLEFVKRAGSKG